MNIPCNCRVFAHSIRGFKERLFGMSPSPFKLSLIDLAVQENKVDSFADLGGVWGVDGAYTFYILSKHEISKAYILDNHFTKKVVNRAKRFPQLQLIQGDMRFAETFENIDKVDFILLFDILLHQVNWQQVLSFCAKTADILMICNPQLQGDSSVRLLELTEQEYFSFVPHSPKEPYYENLFRPKGDKDTPGVWQWGITDTDLMVTLEQLGFQLIYSLDGQYWPNRAFRSKGFMFRKVK